MANIAVAATVAETRVDQQWMMNRYQTANEGGKKRNPRERIVLEN